MNKVNTFFGTFYQKLLAVLHIRAATAGLEVGDRVIRLVHYDGKEWQMNAVRLEAGVMESGRIMDRPALVAALTSLKTSMGAKEKNKKTNVSVVLSSVAMYTQVFGLPAVQGQNFDDAVQLNLQMASPLEAKDSHSGWQVVGKDERLARTDVLSAFVDRTVVDEMVDALFEAGFLAMALEPKSLALTRVLRMKGAGVDSAQSYLVIDIDNNGTDFLIVRNGALHFEYTTQWKDLMDDKGEISTDRFATALAASLRQVLNFYDQHWKEPIAAIILSAVALKEEAEKILAERSPVPVVSLTLVMGQPISSEWLVALGGSLRGNEFSAKEREINLLGEDSKDRFREEQLIRFMRFWSAIVPSALAVLVLTYVGADIFLSRTRTTIESLSSLTPPTGQMAEIGMLQAQATTFNQEVAMLHAVESMQAPTYPVLAAVADAAAANGVTVNHLTFSSFTAPIQLNGQAVAEDHVVNFKAALANDPRITNVNLPLTAVQTQGNTVNFSMSFTFKKP